MGSVNCGPRRCRLYGRGEEAPYRAPLGTKATGAMHVIGAVVNGPQQGTCGLTAFGSRPLRRQLEEELGVFADWWAEQPRCTSTSGWVTVDAAACLEERARRMVAACRLGMAVVKACWEASFGYCGESLPVEAA